MDEDERLDIRLAFEELPVKEAAVLWSDAVVGRGEKETAQFLGISLPQVRRRRKKSVEKLSLLLRGYCYHSVIVYGCEICEQRRRLFEAEHNRRLEEKRRAQLLAAFFVELAIVAAVELRRVRLIETYGGLLALCELGALAVRLFPVTCVFCKAEAMAILEDSKTSVCGDCGAGYLLLADRSGAGEWFPAAMFSRRRAAILTGQAGFGRGFMP